MPENRLNDLRRFGKEIPNFYQDLNAMHEAEKALTEKQRTGDHYAAMIADVTGCDDMLWGFIHATAQQRAEAFLRTVGKWVEPLDSASGKGEG